MICVLNPRSEVVALSSLDDGAVFVDSPYLVTVIVGVDRGPVESMLAGVAMRGSDGAAGMAG